jgi:hypothetical protein
MGTITEHADVRRDVHDLRLAELVRDLTGADYTVARAAVSAAPDAEEEPLARVAHALCALRRLGTLRVAGYVARSPSTAPAAPPRPETARHETARPALPAGASWQKLGPVPRASQLARSASAARTASSMHASGSARA